MKYLRAVSIRVRLVLIVSGVVLGMAVMVGVNLSTQHSTLYTQQQVKIKSLVETAYSIMVARHKQQLDGALTEQQAQQLAMSEIASLRYEGDNYFWLNDYQPVMLMHPFKPQLQGQYLRESKDPDGTFMFRNMVELVEAQGEGFVPYKWPKPGADEPVDKLSFVKGFEPWGWIVGTGVYLDHVDTMFARQMATNLMIAFVVIGVVAGFVYFTGRSILLPANRISQLMEDIAEGEGDLTRRLDVSGKDEISDLANHFNVFSEKMRCSLSELSASSKGVMDYADELQQASHSLNGSTQLQNDASTQVAAAMEQMSVNVKEVSGNAENAEQAAIAAQDNTSSGKQTLSETIEQITSLSGSIDRVSGVITNLSQESDNIGTVLDVIRSIAEQTNLLALNAAIEAARAGEQGRGFAVVADEVRTLASRTGQSTDEIQQMIQRLQSEAQQAVAAVGESQQTSQATIEMAGRADAALSEIDKLMETISQMNSQIARATNQQSEAVDEVTQRVNELSGVADESAEVSNQLAATSSHLRDSSQQMSEVVSRFKLS
ncbi:MAG: methyl-accepting chemotaxis protein [Candidatus Pelagadaptatus aseana]|uniref:methyl-accepting chemotaxis protein n=1 Tax=Candidatus Pelagadaptatus aseana TaxID=3120508 RepID=UPI0039B323FF